MARAAFAFDCLGKIASRQDKRRPYCGNAHTRLLARKKLIAQLRHCPDCELMFLWPKLTAIENKTFHQSAYRESAVTDFPSRDDLARLIASRFRGGLLDYSGRISAVRGIRAE